MRGVVQQVFCSALPCSAHVSSAQSDLKRTQTEAVSPDAPDSKRVARTEVWVCTVSLVDHQREVRPCPYAAYDLKTVAWQEAHGSEGGAKTALVAKMIELDMEFGMHWIPGQDRPEDREQMLAEARAPYENKAYDEARVIFSDSMSTLDVDASRPYFVADLNCLIMQ
jgi:hypothetical protein